MRPLKTNLSLVLLKSSLQPFFHPCNCNACDNSPSFDEHRICCNCSPRFMCQAKSWILCWSPTWDPSLVDPLQVPLHVFLLLKGLIWVLPRPESLLLGAECKAVWTTVVFHSGLNERNWLDLKDLFSVADLLTCILISWTLWLCFTLPLLQRTSCSLKCSLLISFPFPFYHLSIL